MTSRNGQQAIGIGSLVIVLWLIWLVVRAGDNGIGVLAHSGYWIMLALIVVWSYAAYAAIPRPDWRTLRWPLLIAASGVAICFLSTPIGFKVLSDETNLLSVSQSMYQHRTALHPTMGKYYYDNFNATFVSAPTRPLVFPFLLSLLHGFTGYHAWNSFLLNAIVLFVLLVLVCLTVQRMLGIWDAVAAALLVMSQPILPISAASGGFDVLSVLVLFAVLLAASQHIRLRTPDTLVLVWMTLLIFAQVRYESIIALPVVMGYLAVRGYITTEMVRSRFAYFAAGPLFLFPWLLQRHLNRNSFENPPGVPAFSVDHFLNHLSELISVQFDFRFYYPYDNILNVAAVILVCLLVRAGMSRPFADWNREQLDAVAVSILVVMSGLVVFLAHHMGKAGHPTQARFFIPLTLALAGVPILARRLRPEWFSSTALLACAGLLFALYQPVVAESRIMRTLLLTRETNFAFDYLAKFGHHRLLTISDRSGQYAALEYGAVDFPTARRSAGDLLREHQQRLFDEIIVFQEVEMTTNEPLEAHQLPEEFLLQVVAEHQVDGNRKWRISRVIPLVVDE